MHQDNFHSTASHCKLIYCNKFQLKFHSSPRPPQMPAAPFKRLHRKCPRSSFCARSYFVGRGASDRGLTFSSNWKSCGNPRAPQVLPFSYSHEGNWSEDLRNRAIPFARQVHHLGCFLRQAVCIQRDDADATGDFRCRIDHHRTLLLITGDNRKGSAEGLDGPGKCLHSRRGNRCRMSIRSLARLTEMCVSCQLACILRPL
jgi:hypothetical protein